MNEQIERAIQSTFGISFDEFCKAWSEHARTTTQSVNANSGAPIKDAIARAEKPAHQ